MAKIKKTTEVVQFFRIKLLSTTDLMILLAKAVPKRLGGSTVFFLKLSDTPRSIDNFLLSCIKRVTVGTDLYMEILSKS